MFPRNLSNTFTFKYTGSYNTGLSGKESVAHPPLQEDSDPAQKEQGGHPPSTCLIVPCLSLGPLLRSTPCHPPRIVPQT